MKYLYPLILGFGVMLSCGACRQPTPERQICAIAKSQTVSPEPGTQVLTWDLNVTQSQQLTARLLIANNGRLKTATEIDYRWQDWTTTTTASGQVILLLQNGKPFGVQDKQLSVLSVNFPQAPPHSKTEKRTDTVLTGGLEPLASTNSTTNPVLPQRENILYAAVFTPAGRSAGSFNLNSDVESVVSASKGERTVVAVSLQCRS